MSPTKDLEPKLHEDMSRAHAHAKHVLRQLDLTISATNNDQLRAALKRHPSETEKHISRLKRRFEAHIRNRLT